MPPAAIIFVNNDLPYQVKEVLRRQLYLTEIITRDEFDARVSGTPSYPHNIYAGNMRILVLLNFWERRHFWEHKHDHWDRQALHPIDGYHDGYDGYHHCRGHKHPPDVLLFIKAGLATIESNRCGTHDRTIAVDQMTVSQLLSHFPPAFFCETDCCNPCIQNNIRDSLFPDARKPALFPFGSDRNPQTDSIFWSPYYERFRVKGALIENRCEEEEKREHCDCLRREGEKCVHKNYWDGYYRANNKKIVHPRR